MDLYIAGIASAAVIGFIAGDLTQSRLIGLIASFSGLAYTAIVWYTSLFIERMLS